MKRDQEIPKFYFIFIILNSKEVPTHNISILISYTWLFYHCLKKTKKVVSPIPEIRILKGFLEVLKLNRCEHD